MLTETKQTHRKARNAWLVQYIFGILLLVKLGGKYRTGAVRILQNMKSCRLLAPRCHESLAQQEPAPPPGGPPRILQPRECSCSTNNYTHVCHTKSV